MYITWSKPLVCLILILVFNMSKFVKDRFKHLLDTAIIITGTNPIVPATVFHKMGKLSSYVENYYLHTERLMVLIIEPIFNPKDRFYIPSWRDELIQSILLKLASTGLVVGDYFTYIHSFMARYLLTTDLLRKLAYALEEGVTYDEADPDDNIDMSNLFFNFAYGERMESLFFAPYLKHSKY